MSSWVNKPQDPAAESRSSAAIPPTVVDPSARPPEVSEAPDQPTAGVFDPLNSFIVDAIRWHKLLVAAFAALCALIGIAFGLVRQPLYTASATLQVGRVDPSAPGFGSYSESTASLASAFSRSITATPVLGEIQRKLGLRTTQSASRLSSEPIPSSPTFRVIATGSSARSAIDLANVAAGGVVTYVSQSNSSNPQARALLQAYVGASKGLRRARATQNNLPASASRAAQIDAEAAQTAAAAKADALYKSYVAAVGSEASRSGLVSILADATSASDDRRAKLQLFGFIGLLIGLVLGTAAATWRERSPRRLQPLPP
jgi:Chain length determinant protein